LRAADKYYKSKKALKEASMQYILTAQTLHQVKVQLEKLGLTPVVHNLYITLQHGERYFIFEIGGNRVWVKEHIIDKSNWTQRVTKPRLWNGEALESLRFAA
jgi:hypothetical protein